jgi:hypothetical protein
MAMSDSPAERREKVMRDLNAAEAEVHLAAKRFNETLRDANKTINDLKSKLGTARSELLSKKQALARQHDKLIELLPKVDTEVKDVALPAASTLA